MRALSIAATGMLAQQLNTEVIANNIANINTTGFKRARAEFADLLYQSERMVGASVRGGQSAVPDGAQVGLGTRAAGVRQLHLQGAMSSTGNRLDLALNGRGWFQIAHPSGETVYTRSGAFARSATGQLVTVEGYAVQPGITIPQNATEVVINESGQVSARIGDNPQLQQLGQITLAKFSNESGLEAIGGNLYRETASSGSPQAGVPADAGFAQLHQGYLEQSNVDPVKELTDLIAAQRAYEMNSKVIQAADDMFATVTKGLR
jgi:flagellar basal-body rod protein FlgG